MKTATTLFLLFAAAGCFTAASAKGYDAGVAKLEITPKQNMWMSGYGARTKPSTGTLQPLWVKSLAIRDDRRNTFVIVTTDLVGLPKEITDAISARVQKEYNIARANLLFNASHTHTGPFVKANLSTLFSFAPEEQRQVDEMDGQLFVFFAMVVAAAEVAVGLGLVVAVYKQLHSVDVDQMNLLKF